jgi:VWFA-related protein
MHPRWSVVRRFAAAASIAPALLSTAAAQQPSQPQFTDRAVVARILIDARVVDDAGQPVLDLAAADFDVEIGGEPAPIDSVAWVSGVRVSDDELLAAASTSTAPLPQGRLVVLLFQKDMERSRIRGLIRMLAEIRGFLDTFTPDDRVAVLSFDTYLKIWRDFTNDYDDIDTVLAQDVLFRSPGPVQATSAPSLLAHLDPAEARKTYAIEKALRLVANALEPLPGSKSVVLIGHGFGYMTRNFNVILNNRFRETSLALQAARVAVFSLDLTDADGHALEVGLQTVSDETGGFFARTHIFTERALNELEGALAGHYVLFVEKPDLGPGDHRIRVRLTRAKGEVLARLTWSDTSGADR